MKEKTWFILEIETGLVDGWYFGDAASQKHMKKHWDEVRPKYTHIVAEAIVGQNSSNRLPDNRCLNRQPRN